MNYFAKIGAVTYVLWGLLHIQAARLVYVLGQSMEPGIIQGRVYQDAWNLLFFALFGIVVAVTLDARRSWAASLDCGTSLFNIRHFGSAR